MWGAWCGTSSESAGPVCDPSFQKVSLGHCPGNGRPESCSKVADYPLVSLSASLGLRLLFFKTALLRCNLHNVSSTYLKCTIQGFPVCSQRDILPSLQYNCRTFSSPLKETPTHSVTLLFLPPLLKPMATTNLLSVSIDFPALDISCKCSHIMCGLCWSLSLTQYNVFEVHPCCVTCQHLIPFHGWIIFHYMDVPHFVYPSTSWWTFRLFPFLGYL